MERHHLAYLLIAVLVVAAASYITYRRYNSADRKYSRRKLKEEQVYRDEMASRDTPE